jgi:hypothetical protein
MKTVNIFLFLVLTILSAIIVGLTLSNKFKNREEFVTRVLPPTSEPRYTNSFNLFYRNKINIINI